MKKHVLAQQLMDKSSVEACSLEEIRDLANRYPYYAPAQFLLLEKLKQENDPGYTQQLQKAVLYYHNPLAFEFFISSNQFFVDENLDKELETSEINPVNNPDHETILPETGIPANEPNQPSIGGEEWIENQTNDHDTMEHSPTVLVDDKTEPVVFIDHKEDPVDTGIPEEKKKNEEQPVGLDENGALKDEEFVKMPEPLMPEAKTGEAGLSFEPYHTVDYFASQGIKLSQEEIPRDKFGKQLKSFTEWLKTMKRLPANEITTADPTTEKVQHMAEDSVHQSDVVTETMAEVWLKQGNFQKALEIYQQLVLLNPSKKAYFAAQIEKLKRS